MLSVTPSGHRPGPRADDWIRASMIEPPKKRTRQERRLSQSSHVGNQQECKESNPAGRFWRPLASQKHTPVFNFKCVGYPKGVEPSLPASQTGVPTAYTTDTVWKSDFGMGNAEWFWSCPLSEFRRLSSPTRI